MNLITSLKTADQKSISLAFLGATFTATLATTLREPLLVLPLAACPEAAAPWLLDAILGTQPFLDVCNAQATVSGHLNGDVVERVESLGQDVENVGAHEPHPNWASRSSSLNVPVIC